MTLSLPRPAGVSLKVKDSVLPHPLLVGTMVLLAVLSGTFIAVLGDIVGLILAVLIFAAALLTMPRATVWAAVGGGLVVAGLVELYAPGFQTIRWVFALLSMLIAAVSIVRRLADEPRSITPGVLSPGLGVVLLLFALVVLFSIVANQQAPTTAIIGLKNYFQMWGITLALAWLGYQSDQAGRFIKFLGGLALIQLPFVLHQYLVLVPQRSSAAAAAKNIVAVDIVAGTFGGNLAGGGRSADLAILAVIAVTLFFAQWKAGRRRLATTLALAGIAFAPILFNEAKLALVLLPVAMFLLFADAIGRRPFSWLLGLVALLAGITGVILVYSMLPGAESQKSASVRDYVSTAIEDNLGERGYGGAVLNRSTVYRFWWRQHQQSAAPVQILFGHGPGFSNATAIVRGDNSAASRYAGYAIGLTGLSSLLWDTGVVGTGLFLSALFMAFRLGGRLRERWRGSVHEPLIATAQIGVSLIALSLLHNDYVTFDIGFQTMLALLIGYLIAMAKRSAELPH